MIFGPQDLATEERNAWQRGDYVLAEAYALAMDAEDAEDLASERLAVIEKVDALIVETNWRTGKKAELRELVAAIYKVLKGTK